MTNNVHSYSQPYINMAQSWVFTRDSLFKVNQQGPDNRLKSKYPASQAVGSISRVLLLRRPASNGPTQKDSGRERVGTNPCLQYCLDTANSAVISGNSQKEL